jgi:PAS domain S-box-containing protein
MGILTIVSAATIGSFFYNFKKRRKNFKSWQYLIMGFTVHIVMLGLVITLPREIASEILPALIFPVIVVFPLATYLIALILHSQEKFTKTVESLKISENRFRLIFKNNPSVYLLIDPADGSIKDANEAAENFYGFSLLELTSMKLGQISTLNHDDLKKAKLESINDSLKLFKSKHRVSDGSIKEVEEICGPITIKNKTYILAHVYDITEKVKALEDLKQERLLLKTIIDNIPDRVSVKDNNERRILSNLAELLYLGLSHEAVNNKQDSELFPGPLGRQMQEDDHRVLRTGQALINKEEIFPGREGKTLWMLTSKIPLRDQKDKINGLISISRDITQRRAAEEQIRNLSLVAQQTSNLVCIADKNDHIIWVNASYLKRTGYTLEEIAGKKIGEVLRGPETDQQHVLSFEHGLNSKKPFKQEILNYTRSGEKMWLEVVVNPILDNNGEIEKIISISTDITAHKQSELLLKQSIKSYSDLFNSLDEAIFIQDKDGRIIDMNSGARKMYGYETMEFIGKTLEFLSPGCNNTMGLVVSAFNRAYEGEAQKIEFTGKNKNGDIFPKEIHFYPSEYYSQKVVLTIAQDVTARKQSQELKNSLEVARKTTRLKQQFLANISHEMRTPMNGVLGMTSILKKTLLDPTQLKYLRIIDDSARSMLNIINDVLQLSKIEAGKQQLNRKIINSREFCSRIDSLFQQAANSKNLEFSVHCNENVPGFFVSDENKLLQIITNLAGNAIKFTSTGSVKIILEKPSSDNTLKFLVEDTGIGISEQYHQKIFEEFGQVDTSRTRQSGGTGLGLAICKGLVQLLEGTIGLESRLKKGSTFWFTFSYNESTADSNTVQNNHKLNNQEFFNMDILLVEDIKVNQLVASLILKDMGCRVDIAPDGKQAIEKINKKKYDLVLMDIQMPVMDGITAVKN